MEPQPTDQSGLLIDQLHYNGGGKPLFKGLNGHFSLGKIIGITGRNGVGKSTLLHILSGLLKPNQGVVQYNQQNIYQNPDKIKQQISFVPPIPSLYPHLTVAENLRCVALLNEKTSFMQALLDCALIPYQNTLYRKLSDGLKKRVDLAAGLLCSPSFLVLDEPCSALDPLQRSLVWSLLRRWKHPKRLIIFSTHHPEEVIPFCDTVLCLTQGALMPYNEMMFADENAVNS